MEKRLVSLLCVLVWAAACGGDDDEACDPIADTGCDEGLVCENVTAGGEPICTQPLVLKGKVFALAGGAGIMGARVAALDANGSPASPIATTGADGTFELTIPADRNADGTIIPGNVTLRADAQSYLTFPSGIRQSLPINTSTATVVDKRLVIMSALTDIGLLSLPGAGTGSIAGKVAVPESRAGILVVAEPGSGAGATAVADTNGDYKIFNVAAGTWSVKAYAKGVNYTPGSAAVTAGQTATVNLALATSAPAKVSGKIELANPGAGSKTSVILVVESTFKENLARGETPPGLRVGDVSGSFTIEGVPEGKYVVLAAFENDFLVRDPDTGIGGTAIVHQTVTAGATITVAESFKVTGALDLIKPGKDLPEAVTSKPTFSWVDDSSEEGYKVVVFNALGDQVWEKSVDRETGDNPEVPYEGPLVQGMYYQVRAYSLRTKGGAGLRPISATEDLRGVFYMK